MKDISKQELINKLNGYKKFLNDVPEKHKTQFKNLYETLINIIKNTSSMSGGMPKKCQQCIKGENGKCMLCGRNMSRRSSTPAPRRRRNNTLTKKIGSVGKRLGASEKLIQKARQVGNDLKEFDRENTNQSIDRNLYNFVRNIFTMAQRELEESNRIQNKEREMRFHNLYIYVIIPLSCLICVSVHGYLWYGFISTFVWIIEENTAAVDYRAGLKESRASELNDAKVVHTLQTQIEGYSQMNEQEKEQQRIGWIESISSYMPSFTSQEVSNAVAQTSPSPSSSTAPASTAPASTAPASTAPSPSTLSSSKSFKQWGHDIAFWTKKWFINLKYDAKENMLIQLLDQFGQLIRSTGDFIYFLPLILTIIIIRSHLNWAKRVMKENPSYMGPDKDDRDPRGPPKKDDRDPRNDGSGSSSGLVAYGGKRKRRTRRKKRKSRKKSRRKRKSRKKSRRKRKSRKRY